MQKINLENRCCRFSFRVTKVQWYLLVLSDINLHFLAVGPHCSDFASYAFFIEFKHIFIFKSFDFKILLFSASIPPFFTPQQISNFTIHLNQISKPRLDTRLLFCRSHRKKTEAECLQAINIIKYISTPPLVAPDNYFSAFKIL